MRMIAIAILASTPALAEVTPEQGAVLSCLRGMGADTTWEQCAALMFAPCDSHAVGSEGHVACLTDEHAGWQGTMDGERLSLLIRLTPAGAADLGGLMGQWIGYVAQKCADVAAGKPASQAEAAQLGCEISEMAGVTEEFLACGQRQSTAPYCVLQE